MLYHTFHFSKYSGKHRDKHQYIWWLLTWKSQGRPGPMVDVPNQYQLFSSWPCFRHVTHQSQKPPSFSNLSVPIFLKIQHYLGAEEEKWQVLLVKWTLSETFQLHCSFWPQLFPAPASREIQHYCTQFSHHIWIIPVARSCCCCKNVLLFGKVINNA